MGKIEGKVASGLGKGKHFLSIKDYRDGVKKSTGINAYEGTLNVKIDKKERESFLSKLNPIRIDGFKIGSKQYGDIICYKIRTNNIIGAIIVPLKTAHPEDILEIIAEVNLREKLGLKDGDIITINSEE